LKILEIGPGSGYLGMLLANDGHEYFAMDAAQALYLYQKKLWSDVYGADYFDYSESLPRPENAKVTHIPWWRFANLSIPLPNVDILTANHALGEMHENAVRLTFAHLYTMWGDDDKKIIIAESLGYDSTRKDTMFANIRSLGFAFQQRSAGVYTWRPNKEKAQAEFANAVKKPAYLVKTKKRTSKFVALVLKSPIGANLAKFIRRGPRHQEIVDHVADVKTKPIRDFFENLVASEKTADEIFLTQIGQTKF
jgi:hypothetical protein